MKAPHPVEWPVWEPRKGAPSDCASDAPGCPDSLMSPSEVAKVS